MASFSWNTARRPFVCLAPMAGVTDASYRQFIKKMAPDVIVYSEFLSTDALAHGSRKTKEMMHFDPALERPFIVQIFGRKPEHFIEAAKVVEQMGADGVDLNMGCPAAKVVSSSHGSALMKDPDLAAELVAATVKVVRIPVSVKTRLGWDSADNLVTFGQKLVEAGASALAVHGRTYNQKFTGKADWEPLYELKRHVNVPVIGNGDIMSADDALRRLQGDGQQRVTPSLARGDTLRQTDMVRQAHHDTFALDGVMVGRGTFGNPWLLREICDVFSLSPSHVPPIPSPEGGGAPTPTVPKTFAEKIPYILEHCRLAVAIKGEKWGMMEMRRHLASYVRGIPGAAEMRAKLVRVESLAEVERILADR